MSGPSPKTTQGRTQTKDTPNPRAEIKIPDPAGNRTRAAVLEGRVSTDHARATDRRDFQYFKFILLVIITLLYYLIIRYRPFTSGQQFKNINNACHMENNVTFGYSKHKKHIKTEFY